MSGPIQSMDKSMGVGERLGYVESGRKNQSSLTPVRVTTQRAALLARITVGLRQKEISSEEPSSSDPCVILPPAGTQDM